MDNDTKVIVAILAIITILVGVFVWKITTPNEEDTNVVNIEDKGLQQDEIDESSEELLSEKIAIIMFLENTLADNQIVFKPMMTIFVIALAITIILSFIEFKRYNLGAKLHKKIIITLLGIIIVFGYNTLKYNNINNAIEYSIDNEAWIIEKDIVEKKEVDNGNVIIELAEHGKFKTSLYRMYDERR